MSGDCFGSVQNALHGSVPCGASNQLKRKRPSTAGALPPSPTSVHDSLQLGFAPVKRIKCDSHDACTGDKASYIASPPSSPVLSSPAPLPVADAAAMESVKDVVQYQFGFEILMKHKELRLIEQEMAKCQVALEQLRRCHLIPYPTACPTPEQMLDIATGRGTAVRPRPGAAVAKWAAPFGVVDGPYARHYAKWLIPDPVFDGPLPNWPGVAPSARSKGFATAEARATRNSLPDSSRGRPMRGLAGQKLHALSNGYPQPKDKAGPCVLKRADGKVVKLVCIDCHRENFSSTQGFINHCRIAHKRDFKSHEEAAVHCGHPIDADAPPPKKSDPQAGSGPKSASGAGVATPHSSPSTATPSFVTASATASAAAQAAATAAVVASLAMPGPSYTPNAYSSAVPGHVYPLARSDADAVNSLLRHIEESFKQCTSSAVPAKSESTKSKAGHAAASAAAASFVGSDKTPFLSRFMQEKKLSGNLQACVDDAKEVMDLDDEFGWTGDVGDELTPEPSSAVTATPVPAAAAKRMPARQAKATVSFASSMDAGVSDDSSSRRSSSKSVSSQMSFGSASVCTSMDFDNKTVKHTAVGRIYDDDEMDVDLSPNTSVSNNAPSLVSDDGEYDDSDDGSASETSDTDLESMSDVAEINMDEDEDQAHETPRPLRHHRVSAASASAMKLKKDEAKHVAFVSPVTGTDNVDPQPQ
ncbi:hypothetical protein CMQ_1099 [Grosmannia clavigera kw1407]|uniref:AHC1-like C2H2 zinc-finger domain-containing protein n=1 Tax=Grosmannia clavigera (strain kw1407 / UAMH 11150) TaxID=655863 RepID=F0XDV7_GROCL|nr:uncharacterized protein CMQ_1099 [Grosmannia clavigera kw1407]EFX04171.1 hypothetical protein CMQ_1099 [Grosmannia clavigera kw1407]